MSRPLIVAHTGTGGERGRIMSPDGISVALSATDYKDPPKVLVSNLEPKILEIKERKEDIADRD